MTSDPLVLLQTSDWHVGSALTSRNLGLSPELRETRRDEVDGAAERAVAAARASNADGLVVPGDLWDAECVAPAVIHRLLAALASFGPRPVFIAPGNHDFAGPGGWYEPSVLAALGELAAATVRTARLIEALEREATRSGLVAGRVEKSETARGS